VTARSSAGTRTVSSKAVAVRPTKAA
jgi:hypothetical protein